MVFFWTQEGEAVGGGILQLPITDRDTPQNGPPFSFYIVSGNEDRSFHIDQGGLLSVSSPLRRRDKPQHLLKIQVKDFIHSFQLRVQRMFTTHARFKVEEIKIHSKMKDCHPLLILVLHKKT